MIRDVHINDSSGEGFPLEHSDLGLLNIFVDDDFNITCIIDWGLCSTVPLETLVILLSRHEHRLGLQGCSSRDIESKT